MGPTSYFPPPLTETNVAPLVPAAGAQEYTIQKGDKFATLAPKFGVTVKAIQEANPNVDPRKLQIGQKIQIPAPTAAPSKSAAGTAETNASGQQIYTVKSGDNLTKIAREFGTTVRALRSENNLTTDRIKVGDKLKIPASASAPAAGGQM